MLLAGDLEASAIAPSRRSRSRLAHVLWGLVSRRRTRVAGNIEAPAQRVIRRTVVRSPRLVLDHESAPMTTRRSFKIDPPAFLTNRVFVYEDIDQYAIDRRHLHAPCWVDLKRRWQGIGSGGQDRKTARFRKASALVGTLLRIAFRGKAWEQATANTSMQTKAATDPCNPVPWAMAPRNTPARPGTALAPMPRKLL
jgi:hypothetical protein